MKDKITFDNIFDEVEGMSEFTEKYLENRDKIWIAFSDYASDHPELCFNSERWLNSKLSDDLS